MLKDSFTGPTRIVTSGPRHRSSLLDHIRDCKLLAERIDGFTYSQNSWALSLEIGWFFKSFPSTRSLNLPELVRN